MNNDLLEKNLLLFSKRFEHLHAGLLALCSQFSVPKEIELCKAKNAEISATYEKTYMHSAYNPSAEAKKHMQSNDITKAESVVFLGAGLGYGPIACASQHPSKTIIIIEPNPLYILLSFSCLDWEIVFEHQSLVFLLEAPQNTVITILEQYGLTDCFFLTQKAIMQHASEYFANIQTLISRNVDKQAINMRTLEKFSTLWLSNMCKNFSVIEHLAGIKKFKNQAQSLSACVLAAGPTLDSVLPYLHEIQKRCILICVDTALRACLSVGVQPDFIILVDPQYWNARHIEGLQSSESILITESAAYPSVFRFECKEILLCSSLFPLGKYIEQFTGEKGELAAGGSVATTAWDFARFIGCKSIFMAGLDLSFPEKKTHTRGSTFEEKSHIDAHRIFPTETALAKVLYNPQTDRAKDYEGTDTITDARMKLYAWWFESKCATYPEIRTYSLSKKSLYIPLVEPISVENVLSRPIEREKIISFMNTIDTNTTSNPKGYILNELLRDFDLLQDIVKKGINLCNKHYSSDFQYEKAITLLSEVDTEIFNSAAKNIVSLIFPTPEKLQQIISEKLPQEPPPPPKGSYTMAAQYNIAKTKILYELIKNSIDLHIHYLRKNV